jgi:Tfp pilus assembly PilM family ATPase
MTAAAKAVYPRKAAIERTIAAARAAGMKVGGFEVDPDGTIRILSERASPAVSDAYDRWSAKKAR